MLVEFPNNKFTIFFFNNQPPFQVKLKTMYPMYSIICLERKRKRQQINFPVMK